MSLGVVYRSAGGMLACLCEANGAQWVVVVVCGVRDGGGANWQAEPAFMRPCPRCRAQVPSAGIRAGGKFKEGREEGLCTGVQQLLCLTATPCPGSDKPLTVHRSCVRYHHQQHATVGVVATTTTTIIIIINPELMMNECYSFFPAWPPPVRPHRSSRFSHRADVAQKLLEVSEQLTGIPPVPAKVPQYEKARTT